MTNPIPQCNIRGDSGSDTDTDTHSDTGSDNDTDTGRDSTGCDSVKANCWGSMNVYQHSLPQEGGV